MSHSLFSLSGRRILVTGASSGIGRAVAVAAAGAGAEVIVSGRNEQRLAVTLEKMDGEGHRAVAADLRDSEALSKLAGEAAELDGVAHCAGAARLAPIRYTNEKLMREMLSVNTEAPMQLTRELLAARHLRSGASLVFVSSLSALHGWTGYVAYGASKGALISASRAMACELAPKKIRCNCLCPGMVRTPMLKGGFSEEQLAAEERNYPLGFGRPKDVAATLVFFLSDASRWITGQVLTLDGGEALRR